MSRLDEAVAAARSIPGWMSPNELRWLGEQASKYKKIVEVGSYCGRSTKALVTMCPGMVYSVDNLHGEVDAPHPDPVAEAIDGKQMDLIFRENLAEEIEVGKLKVVREGSPSAARLFKKNSVDMVFIDGDHSTGAVLRDIRAWLPKIVEGGLLCGHDRPDPQVWAALTRMGIKGHGPDRIWWKESQ